MPAGHLDLYVEAGATFQRIFTWLLSDADDPTSCSPKNLAGYTARAQIRESAGAADPPLLNLTSSPVAGLAISAVAGSITMTITDSQTASLVSGVWSIELTAPGGFIIRLLEGDVVVSPEVTR